MSLTEGLHYISVKEYDADPCPEPSLRSTDARTMISKTPLHVYHQHPRLGGDAKREEKAAFDLGNAAHALMTGQGKIEVLPEEYQDYRKKGSKALRDAAYEQGKTPMLSHQFSRVETMVGVGGAQLAETQEAQTAFKDGKGESTLIWKEGSVWCRARLDWLPNDREAIYPDYKTTAIASPGAWSRYAFGAGMDIQAAMYLRGIRKVLGVADPRWRWIVQETESPFPLSVVALDPHGLDLAERRFEYALRKFSDCLKSGKWPAYPRETCYVGPPVYLEEQWLQMESE